MNKRFQDQQNANVREFDLSQPVVNIGGHAENDIVLSGADVLPFHATLIPQDHDFQLIALDSPSSIKIDGISPSTSPVSITPQQRVEIGSYSLSFKPGNGVGGVHVRMVSIENGLAVSRPETTTYSGESPILVNVTGQVAEIDVEQTAYFDLEIINAGQIVAGFSASVSGVPDSWISITPRMVNLNEGQRATIRVSITPPRDPSSTAGKHNLVTTIESSNYPGFRATTQLALTIKPYYEFSVHGLSPKQQNIFWSRKSGITKLPISNHGNSTADFSVSAADDENGCTFDFLVSDDKQVSRQAVLNVPSGETTTLPIEITPLKQPMVSMRVRRYHYTATVQLAQQTVTPQTLSGTVTAIPLIGWWSIVLAIALLLVGTFFLLQPRISSFEVASGKDVIERGDTTRLVWQVSPFATRLSLSNVEQGINYGQTSLTIAPTISTTYELVAGNWLSGLMGLDRKKTVTVLVVPPTPNINVFEVDSTKVAQGVPVNVRWSVTKADQAFLTIDEVVYELKPEGFSGERSVVLTKDSLVTLDARNSSGSQLRSYFINVVPPNITVNSFTVWVKQQAMSGLPSIGTLALNTREVFTLASAPPSSLNPDRFRMTGSSALVDTPPDPNFPEKYVELVPDKNSDSGYRVEFYEPDRELAKGEQIMLEWDVNGVDKEKVQITPFAEELPSRGAQPFFPQESMNFVMTAKSGDLEKLFMLPVKVFDGAPPTAPKIEFFKATPLKSAGATNVQFAWSVSGEWDRVQITTEGKTVADYLNAQGFKTISVTKSTTFILTAFNGSLSSSSPLEITIDPALAPIGMYFKSAFPATGRFLINEKVSFTVGFYDPAKSNLTAVPPVYVEPTVKPTGVVLVTDGFSICTINLPAQTCDLVFKTPGDPKLVTASYDGDKTYLSASTDKAYDQYIAVVSSTTTITPTYYLLDRTTPADSVLNSPISINTSPLSLDTGLYIRVTITPQGAPLPSPDAGKVNLYICNQQASGSGWQVVPGSCQPRGFASVTQVGSKGQADIVLDSFPNAGTFALLLSYSATGFVPTERPEFNVVVKPTQIYLSLPTSVCTDPKTFTGCQIGTSTPSSTKIVFDILKTIDDEKLSSQLTAPRTAAFEVFEMVGASESPWSCQVVVVTESGSNFHKLECIADVSAGTSVRSPVNVNFRFDNALDTNYSMTPNTLAAPFQLAIKQNTRISLSSPKFLGLKVGQWVKLTSSTTTDTANPNGAVILTNTAFQHVNANGPITLTAAQTGVLGIEASQSNISNCTVDASGQTVTISSITTDCAIFFKKTGTFSLSVAFAGDINFYSSSSVSPLSVTVAKQDGVTVTWKQSASYVAWGDLSAIAPNTDLPIRLELGGPAGFSGAAFAGQRVVITLAISGNANNGTCNLSGSSVSGSFPTYNVNIDTSTTTPRADFTLRCDREPMTVSITAALQNTTDFNIKAGETVTRVLGILNRGNSYMNIDFRRVADNAAMLTSNTVNKLHIGEKYTLQITVGRLWADAWEGSTYSPRQAVINKYINDQNKVTITLDADIYNQINWPNSTCLQGSAANTVQILMNQYRVVYDFGNPDLNQLGITDIELYNSTPCVLYFDKAPIATVTGASDPTVFAFSVANPNNTGQIFSVNSSYSTPDPALDRQSVTITPSTTAYTAFVDSASSNITLDFTPEVPGTTLTPLLTANSFPSQFSVSSPCTNLYSGTITTSTRATLTLTPSAVGSTCNGTLNVAYSQNSWFKSNNSTNITVNVGKHNPSVAVIQYLQGIYRDFVPTFPTLKVGQNLDMRVGVSNGDAPVNSALIPTGVVEVWLENSAGAKQPASIYTVTLGTGITYDATNNIYLVTLDSSGNASFTLNFVGAITNANLKYRYAGDSKYNASAASTAGPLNFVP